MVESVNGAQHALLCNNLSASEVIRSDQCSQAQYWIIILQGHNCLHAKMQKPINQLAILSLSLFYICTLFLYHCYILAPCISITACSHSLFCSTAIKMLIRQRGNGAGVSKNTVQASNKERNKLLFRNISLYCSVVFGLYILCHY